MAKGISKLFASREATMRAAFLSGASPSDMVEAMEQLKTRALEDGEFEALKLFLQMTVGLTNKGQRMLPPLDLPKTATLSECGEAIDVVLSAMTSGYLSQEEAEGYVSVIDKRATIIRAKNVAGEGLGDNTRPIQVIIQERAEAAKQS